MSESERAITAETLENARSTAMYVSEAVVGQIERRWGALREEADDPQMVAWLRSIQESGSEAQPFRKEFAEWIQSVRERHADLPSASWFVDDATGIQHAIDPVGQGGDAGAELVAP